MGLYKNKNGKLYKSSHYFPPELMPIAICAACQGIVLKESPEAKELYNEIVECYKLPGFQEIFNKLNDEIPEGQELIKKIVDKSGLDYKKPPDMGNAGNKYSGWGAFTLVFKGISISAKESLSRLHEKAIPN